MTSFENPKAIRHFQSICDNLQDLVTRFHTPSDLKLYSDGYLQALRNCSGLEQKDQEKLERLIERWILDPSSFIDPDGDGNKGCLLYTSPSPRDVEESRMPSSA